MKKRIIGILGCMTMIAVVNAGDIAVNPNYGIENNCSASNKDVYYYLTGSMKKTPSDIAKGFNSDIFVDTGNSEVRLWTKAGVITNCNNWKLDSNVIPTSSNPKGSYWTEGACWFDIPNYTKVSDPTALDAQISFKLGYHNKINTGGTQISGKFYYNDVDKNKYRCYPNGNEVSDVTTCSSNIYIQGTLKTHTGECLNYRVFRCGDGLVNGRSKTGATMTNYTNGSYVEQCDPNDPDHTNWGVNGCTITCERDDTPTAPTCGNGIIETGEDCEFGGTVDKTQMPAHTNQSANNYQAVLNTQGITLAQGISSAQGILDPIDQGNINLGCDRNTCTLKPVSCTLNASPMQQLIGEDITFTATKSPWAKFVSLDYDDEFIERIPTFPEYHDYQNAGNFTPTLTVQNNYSGLIRTGVEIPTATCDLTIGGTGGTGGTGDPGIISVVSGCKISLSAQEIELGDSISVTYNIRGKFVSPTWLNMVPQFTDYVEIILNGEGNTVGTIIYGPNDITSTGTYKFSISGNLNNEIQTPFYCESILNVVDKKIVDLDVDKKLDYIDNDIVHYTITMTNNGNTISDPTYILDIMPTAIDYLTSSIVGVSNYIFSTGVNDDMFIFYYSGFTVSPNQEIVVSVTGKIIKENITKQTVQKIMSNMQPNHVKGMLSRCFDSIYKKQTENCVYTTSGVLSCAGLPKPYLEKTQKVGNAEFTDSLIVLDGSNIITYRVDFSNVGSGMANPVRLVDDMPYCIEYVDSQIYGVTGYSFDDTQAEDGRTVLTYSNFSLDVGQEGYLIITGRVKNTSDCDIVHSYTNNAYLYFYHDVLSDSVIAKRNYGSGDLGGRLKKDADLEVVQSGDIITYTITYQNTGKVSWNSGYTLRDFLPSEISYGGYSCENCILVNSGDNNYVFKFSEELGINETGELIITGIINACPEDGKLVNNVLLTVSIGELLDEIVGNLSAQNEVECDGGGFGGRLKKESQVEKVESGGIITYTITYGNTGSKTWNSGYEIEDEWPKGVKFENYSCEDCELVSSGNNKYVFKFKKELGVNKTGKLVLTGKITDLQEACESGEGDEKGITNKANLNYWIGNTNNEISGGITTENIIGCDDPIDPNKEGGRLKKDAQVEKVISGGIITYTITYGNTGSKTWNSGYEIEDDWPKGVKFENYSCEDCELVSSGNNKYVFKFKKEFGVNKTGKLVLTGMITDLGEACESGEGDEKGIKNKANLNYWIGNTNNEISGGITTENIIGCEDPIDPNNGGRLKKEAQVEKVESGGIITYTITYGNTGSKTWNSGYEIEDEWPAGVDFGGYRCEDCELVSSGNNKYVFKFKKELEVNKTGKIVLTGKITDLQEACESGEGDGKGIKNKANLNYWIGNTNNEISGGITTENIIGCDDPIDPNKEGGRLKKEAQVEKVISGGIITYTITYGNTGSKTWNSGYEIEDEWPAGVEFGGYRCEDCELVSRGNNKYVFKFKKELEVNKTGKIVLTGMITDLGEACESGEGDGKGIKNKANLNYWIGNTNNQISGGITTENIIGCKDPITDFCNNDGILDSGEDCDGGYGLSSYDGGLFYIFDYLDYNKTRLAASDVAHNSYYCTESCKLEQLKNNHEIPSCLNVDTTISIMEGELFPFWWRIWGTGVNIVDDSDDSCDYETGITKVQKSSMICSFEVYGPGAQSQKNKVNSFSTGCFLKNKSNEDTYFKPFSDEAKVFTRSVDFDNVAGRQILKIESLLNIKKSINTYGEYKLALTGVSYKYCAPDKKWKDGELYNSVCEVNFVVTKPYLMQINTAGIPSSTSGEFLSKFKDISGTPIIQKTDLTGVVQTSRELNNNIDVSSQIQKFKKKYESLAVADSTKMYKKVPGKEIYFIENNNTGIIIQFSKNNSKTIDFNYNKNNINIKNPMTIFVQTGNVIISGSIDQNIMVIANSGTIQFNDNCTDGGQIVNGIFVAGKGFVKGNDIKNNSKDRPRCHRGNLKVKGVLIGSGVEKVTNSRRANLNSRFQTEKRYSDTEKRYSDKDELLKERRMEIFNGASLLIEYNQALWSNIIPGSEIFTELLTVSRK